MSADERRDGEAPGRIDWSTPYMTLVYALPFIQRPDAHLHLVTILSKN